MINETNEVCDRIMDIINHIPSSILEKRTIIMPIKSMASQKMLDFESKIKYITNIAEREKEEKELLISCLRALHDFIEGKLVKKYVKKSSAEIKKIQDQLKKYFAEEFKKNFSAWLS